MPIDRRRRTRLQPASTASRCTAPTAISSSNSCSRQPTSPPVPSAMVLFRSIWKGVLITAGGFTGEAADAAIRNGHADAVAFGRIFISNPDLPRRLQRGFPLTPYNRATFYGGDSAGYTDYPEHNELEQA